jgi:chemotaxis protein CheX
MSATAEISENLIRSHITRAVGAVFKTMLGRSAQLCPKSHQGEVTTSPPVPSEPSSKVQVVGTVGFLGDLSGLIYLHFDLEFARLSTCHLLGMTAAELEEAGDEVINDAIGEITNMTVGSFKNALCDAGFPCKLTIPSILRGSNFCVEPISSAQRHIYRFDCGGSIIVADILMKVGD